MKIKLSIIILSLILAFIAMSGGYALWTQNLTIKGSITVVQPEALATPQQPTQDTIGVSTQNINQENINTTTETLKLP